MQRYICPVTNEVFVKEEIDLNEEHTPRNPLQSTEKQIITAQPDTKCGEVHFGQRGNYVLVCAICSYHFENLETFGLHIREYHLEWKPGVEFSAVEDLHAQVDEDPFRDSPGDLVDSSAQSADIALLNKIKHELANTSSINETKTEGNFAEDISSSASNVHPAMQASEERTTTSFCKICCITYRHQRSYVAHARRVHGILTKRMRNKLIRETRRKTRKMTENRVVSSNEDSGSIQAANQNRENKERFSCALCTRAYKHRRSLRFHIRTDHGTEALHSLPVPAQPDDLKSIDLISEDEWEGPPLHQCRLCSRTYRHRRSLRFHMRVGHGQTVVCSQSNDKACQYCDKEFVEKDALETHIENDHVGDRKYICPHCPKVFRCRSSRQAHINTHTGERPFKCPHCSKAFSNTSNLSVHIRTHLQIKKHSCSFCDKRFVSTSEKKRHERTHTGEKLFQCEECGKRYPTRNKLNEHIRRHKNLKNYKCDVCGKTFYTMHMLKDHQSAHSTARPYTCNVCSQSFPRRRALRVHEQLHSDVKKYVCNTCGKAFAQCAGLYSHQKSHGEKLR